MPTQYVNKATLNGTSTVYWTTTGAPDTTGAQSGYIIANLTNIGVDYTTSVSVTTVGSGGTTVLVPTRYTPTDSSTIINWKFDETTSPYLNSGSGTALPLTTFSGTQYKLYINGIITETYAGGPWTAPAWTTAGSGTRKFGIMGNANSASAAFIGQISRVRMSNIARSQAYCLSVYKKAFLY